MRPMQDGDVKDTYADTARLQAAVGFVPSTPLEVRPVMTYLPLTLSN